MQTSKPTVDKSTVTGLIVSRERIPGERATPLIFVLLILATATVAHELIHGLLAVLQSSDLVPCENGLPLTTVGVRPKICIRSPHPLNAAVTPALTAALGVVIAWYSHRVAVGESSTGGTVGGLLVAFRQSLYGMGYYTPPVVTADNVLYLGDGRLALEAYGYLGILPSSVTLLASIILLAQTVRFTH